MARDVTKPCLQNEYITSILASWLLQKKRLQSFSSMYNNLRIFSERIYHNQEKNERKQTFHLDSYTTKRKLNLNFGICGTEE